MNSISPGENSLKNAFLTSNLLGSFDCAAGPLREPATSLRMTGMGMSGLLNRSEFNVAFWGANHSGATWYCSKFPSGIMPPRVMRRDMGRLLLQFVGATLPRAVFVVLRNEGFEMRLGWPVALHYREAGGRVTRLPDDRKSHEWLRRCTGSACCRLLPGGPPRTVVANCFGLA